MQGKFSFALVQQHWTVSYCWKLHLLQQQYKGKVLLPFNANNGYANTRNLTLYVQCLPCWFYIASVLWQWYSTWGTRTPGGTLRHLRGYVEFKKINILFHDKHWIIMAIFRVSHKRPGRKNMRFGSAIFSLSLLYAILIWADSFILFHIVHIILLC
jgi:hypothetical protein